MNPFKNYLFRYGNIEFLNEPFYIGKGIGDRYLHHLNKVRNKNKYKINEKFKTIEYILEKNNEPIIEKIYCESEKDALELEKKLITSIGRSDIGMGPLTNRNDGGQKPQDNYKHSEETRRKISESIKNREPDGRYKIISPSGDIYENVNLIDFCKENKLNYHKIRKSSNMGKIKIKITKNAKIETLNCENWEVINVKSKKIKTYKIKYILTSPDGKQYKITTKDSLINLCSKLNLNLRTLSIYRNKGKIEIRNIDQCEKIESKNCQGWSLVDPNRETNMNYFKSTRKEKWKIISPSGEIIFINNLKKFCHENNLSERTFRTFTNRGKIELNLKKFYHEKFKNSIGWECWMI